MIATRLDGVATATAVKNELKARIDALKAKGITPGLGTLRVSSSPSGRPTVRPRPMTTTCLPGMSTS
jgi:methylenetetrahydrofolate dehydrogenase (NADP+)/methenyltetrahydrofolate cyclohydrolase